MEKPSLIYDLILLALLALVWSLIQVRGVVRWLRHMGFLPSKRETFPDDNSSAASVGRSPAGA